MAGIAKEVKVEILAKVKAGEKVSELSKQYGVSDKTIYNWLRGQVTEQVSWREYKRVMKENEQLKQILGVLTLELEKTKKRSVISRDLLVKLPHLDKSLLAQVLGISRRWLYQSEFVQQSKDEELKEQILTVLAHQSSYGHRRIALELGVGKKRVRRVMKRCGIKPYKRKARWRKRKDERRKPAPFTNEIRNQCPLIPNHTWVGDFTYLRFKSRFLYLATFMDLFTREIVGWHLATTHTKTLVLQAFFDGLVNRNFHKPIVIHSDQGVEYTSKDYLQLMQDCGIQVSMSTKASPWENGYQESFYNNFKTDLGLEFDRFQDEGHFLEAIHHTLYNYNHHRIHTTLKMSPAKFHARYLESVCTKRDT